MLFYVWRKKDDGRKIEKRNGGLKLSLVYVLVGFYCDLCEIGIRWKIKISLKWKEGFLGNKGLYFF